jgi:hypothetical protein
LITHLIHEYSHNKNKLILLIDLFETSVKHLKFGPSASPTLGPI